MLTIFNALIIPKGKKPIYMVLGKQRDPILGVSDHVGADVVFTRETWYSDLRNSQDGSIIGYLVRKGSRVGKALALRMNDHQ